MKLVLVALAALTLAGCPSPVVPPGPEDLDAGRAASCASACTHLRSLACEAGQPTPHGATCEVVCDNARSGPVEARWATSCIAHAPDCSSADSCR